MVSVLVLVLWSWVLVPLPVLSAGKVHRCWCQLIVRAVKVP